MNGTLALRRDPGKSRAEAMQRVVAGVPEPHRAPFARRYCAMAAWNCLLFAVPVPLKVGIYHDLRSAGAPLSGRALKAFLYRWVRHPEYCRRLAQWEHRLDVQGRKQPKAPRRPHAMTRQQLHGAAGGA